VRLPGRLIRALLLVAVAAAATAADADAGPDPGLCHSTAARADIQADFGVDACFDGSHLVLSNKLTLVLDASKTGDVGNPVRHESDYGLAADAERVHSHDPGIFLPGDKLTYPVGLGAGTVGIRSSGDNGFYAIATTVADFVPGKPAAVVNAFTALVAELTADYARYQKCIAGKNWLGQLGCDAVRTRDVTFALSRAGVSGLAHGAVSAVLSPATWAKWVDANVHDSKASLSESGLIRIAAASSKPAPKPKPKPAPTPSTSPPAADDSFAIGSPFASWCVVAWPTAPTVSSEGIEMTMSCEAVPEDQYLFTDVSYGDPNLPISPDHSRAYVEGTVTDVARSEYGFSELVVEASKVTVE
jgi:hypothetical protein